MRFPPASRLLPAAFATCLFLLIVGAKWATLDRFGSAMPDWDQWDAEAAKLIVPWFEDRGNFVAALFHPHNEHRVVLTKLQNLGLMLLNGQWDARLEAATNAFLHSAIAVALWLISCGWIARGSKPPDAPATAAAPLLPAAALFILTAILFGLPLAWQNVLGGFHSQQYWLIGLSLVVILTLPFVRPWSGLWWLGGIAAVLALGSMGSGLLASVVAGVVIAWRGWRRDAPWRELRPALAVAILITAIGLAAHVDEPGHAGLKAAGLHDFVFSIIRSLQWPLSDCHVGGLLMWLPWLLTGAHVVRSRDPAASRVSQAIVALGGWVLVQVAATAYARGAGGADPASRYMDTLAFGMMINAIAAAWLLACCAATRLRRTVVAIVALAWLAGLGVGLRRLWPDLFHGALPGAREYYRESEGNVRRYLGTGDPRQLSQGHIPYPSADALIHRLANPHVRMVLPDPVRLPIPVDPAPGNSPVFRPNDARGWELPEPPTGGLSPLTPPLDFTVTWGSFGGDSDGTEAVGEWRSKPLTSPLGGWLKFEVAGQPGGPGESIALELRDAGDDALVASVFPSRIPGDAWRAAYVRAPNRPFILAARDGDTTRWLAFSGPVEMGSLSYWAWRGTKHGLLIVYMAAGATLALVFAASVRLRLLRASTV